MRARSILAVASLLAPFACVACMGDDTSVGSPADAAADATLEASTLDSGGGADAAVDAGPVVIDRMGRPAISTALLDRPLKDPYNAENTYASPFASTYDDSFERHLEALDTLKLDGTHPDAVDWPVGAGPHPLRDPLKLDVLIVDTAKPCSSGGAFAASYLEIESEVLLGGAAHKTCGGRTPSEDVMDKTMTLLVTKGRAPVSDNVNAPTKPATTTFPYLAEPN